MPQGACKTGSAVRGRRLCRRGGGLRASAWAAWRCRRGFEASATQCRDRRGFEQNPRGRAHCAQQGAVDEMLRRGSAVIERLAQLRWHDRKGCRLRSRRAAPVLRARLGSRHQRRMCNRQQRLRQPCEHDQCDTKTQAQRFHLGRDCKGASARCALIAARGAKMDWFAHEKTRRSGLIRSVTAL